MQQAHKLPCLEPVTEHAPFVQKVCKAVLDRFKTAPYSIAAQNGKVK